ncbi:MAG: hypothetical protein V1718_06295 [archaeon]
MENQGIRQTEIGAGFAACTRTFVLAHSCAAVKRRRSEQKRDGNRKK